MGIGKTHKGKQVEFIVGRPADTSENEAQRRIESIKSLYRNQCDEHGVEYWKPISLTYARKIACGQQNPLTFNVSYMGKRDQYYASEDFQMFRELQRVGVNIVPDDPSTAEVTTLREALELFKNYLEETSPKTESGLFIPNRRKLRDQSQWLIKTHDIIPP